MSYEIAQILSNRDKYFKYSRYIIKYIAQKELQTILTSMKIWFKTSSEDEIVWSDFIPWFFIVSQPNCSAAKKLVFDDLFESLSTSTKPPAAEHLAIMNRAILNEVGKSLMEIGMDLHIGKGSDVDEVIEVVEKYQAEVENITYEEEDIVTTDITQIITELNSIGYDWPIKFFNQSLGPLRKGNFIVLAARPETGKTTMICHIANWMAKQVKPEERVYIFNNEGMGENYRIRLIQNELGCTFSDITKNPADLSRDYESRFPNGNSVMVVGRKFNTTRDVTNILSRNAPPGLIIFDQLWKMHGFEKESSRNSGARLGMLFNWGRELATTHCPVITVHQADNSAEGARYIHMNQLHESKTALQGEADVIITMGKSHEAALENTRFIYVPKNKLLGDNNTIPALRHGRTELQIVPETAQWLER